MGKYKLCPRETVNQVYTYIVESIYCRYCGEPPVSVDDDGIVEGGCCPGCPHEGADMNRLEWLRANTVGE